MTNKQCERRLAQALGALHPKTDFSAVAGAMPAPAAATPVSVSRMYRVRRYVAAVAAAAVMVAGVGTWWLTRPEDKPPVVPATDDGTVTTTVTTEGEDTTTTTVNTTITTIDTTTDGGIVTPPTTAPTTTASSKIEPPKTTAPSKTQSPTVTTVSQMQPSATTPSKTEPSKTNPTQPTVSQTRPTATQTKPTQTTPTTQPTVPPVEDDYIVVDTPIGTDEPIPAVAMSAKLPATCNVTDEYVTVSLSYGPLTRVDMDPNTTDYCVLRIVTDEQEEVILRKFSNFEMNSYFADLVLNEKGDCIGVDYSHTEMIQLPLSLCSKDSGYMWIDVRAYDADGKWFKEVTGSVLLYYYCSGTSVTFSVDSIWGWL